MQNTAKEDILKAAGKYISRFNGKFFVIKYGGSLLDDKEASSSILDDILCLKDNGINIVIVHGGGSEISRLMHARGKKPQFVKGVRVTDAETAGIVDEALSTINKGIVDSILKKGANAESVLSSVSPCIIAKRKKGAPEEDFVGEVSSVDKKSIEDIAASGKIAVLSPVGTGTDRKLYNINADIAAAEVAAAIGAEKLIMLTDVRGVMLKKNDESSLISTLEENKAKELIEKGIIESGMIPKVEAGMLALDKGVKKVHMVSGRTKNALLAEVFTDKGIGTEIIK